MKHRQQKPSNPKIHLHRLEQEAGQFQRLEKPRNRKLPLPVILALVLWFLFLGSLLLLVPYRQWTFTPAWVFESVQSRFQQFFRFLSGGAPEFGILLGQYLAIMLAGAALAACGTIFQGSFKNILAGPSSMGVMPGGTLGCLLYLILCTAPSGSALPLQLSTLLGCLGGVALVLLVATISGRGRISPPAMLLSGTVFSSLITNCSMLLQYYIIRQDPADPRIETVRNLMMGSVSGVTSAKTVGLMAAPILACLLFLLIIRNRLNLLALEEDEARSMGVNPRALRYLTVGAGTLLTAVVVSFCGHIGFLGAMIPLIGRKMAGPDMRTLLPASMLLGAILLVLVFDAAYIVGMTDYLNLFTSVIGGIVMATTLFRRRGGKSYAPV